MEKEETRELLVPSTQMCSFLTRGLATSYLKAGKVLPKSPKIFLFVHGFPDHPSVWQSAMNRFASDGLCLAPYLRGLPESPLGPNENRASRQAVSLDFMEILDKEDPTATAQLVLIGHDIGTLHAAYLAKLLRDRLALLVLASGAPLEIFLRRFLSFSQMKKSWYTVLFQIPKVSDLFFEKIGNRFLASDFPWKGNRSQIADSLPLISHYRMAFRESWKTFVPTTDLGKPVLWISGLKDPYLNPVNLGEAKRFSSQSHVRSVNCGHWDVIQNSDKLYEWIHKELQQ